MRIGVLGTGAVGRTLGGKLAELDHEVRLGSRSADNEDARAWAAERGERASHGTFAEAAAFGELLVNATAGVASMAALESVDATALAGKVLVDVANPLDFSQGMPPTLAFCNDDSLGERIQRTFPDLRVVKSLNTVNAEVMVDPGQVPGRHTVFVAGDDDGAKEEVRGLLHSFGWPEEDVLDLGDVGASRGLEMYLPLWLRLWQATGSGRINVAVQRP